MRKILKEIWLLWHIIIPVGKIISGRWHCFRDCPDLVILEMYYEFKKPFDDLSEEEIKDFNKIGKQISEEYLLRKRQRDKLRINRRTF